MLALAIFVFTIGHRREGSWPGIFTTSNDEGAVESRFTKFLRSVIDDNEQTLLDFGLEASSFISKRHCHFLYGMCGGPTAIAIYLRAGWNLGNVQQRYILAGDGGDQVSDSLKLTEPSFTALPPHVYSANGPALKIAQWEHFLPGYSTFYPDTFKPVLNYLLASLAYHREFLQERLHPAHPLFDTRIWRSGGLMQLASKVIHLSIQSPVWKQLMLLSLTNCGK